MTYSIDSLLRERFRLKEFRKGQREIIESVLANRDALAVMPTGGGKSLCYQLPALCREGIAVVVSPLVALMEDQVKGLKALGIPAGCLHSGQTLAEKRAVFGELRRERHFVLYLSPERVQKSGFGEWAKRAPIRLFAVDESHCVSQWGPDFRKDYYRLSLLRDLRPEVPILALTATATPLVLGDIARQLGLRRPDRHVHGFYRPNLYYQVESCDQEAAKVSWIRQGLKWAREGRVLIYCGTRRQTEDLANELSGEFSGFGFYHAGMDADERMRIQKDYGSGALRILACTNAFGMGVDFPDVRLVVHYQMPANVESFYQEMGRAGRDGLDSTCLLLYAKRDKGLHSYFIQQSETEGDVRNRRWRALDTMIQFAEGGECRHGGILTYFKDSFRTRACGHCDVCAPDSPRRVPAPEYWTEETAPASSRRSRSSSATKTVSALPLSAEEEVRVEVLRQWRKDYADENDIPAFLVFSNKTLRDLAQKNPATLDELSKVYGLGPHKVEHLGALILEQLASCR